MYFSKYRMTSDFGKRVLSDGDNRFHNGIDFVGIDSKKITSNTAGIVKSATRITDKSNPTWEWGNYVRIDDFDGYSHFYCHLATTPYVNKGDVIEVGTVIGVEGDTGRTLGAHCHYEVRNTTGVSIDPKKIFPLFGMVKMGDEIVDNHIEAMSIADAKKIIKDKAGIEDKTLSYLEMYKYSDDLIIKLAKGMK